MYAAQPTKRRGGFTLVEMLVVITIMLALAALGTAFLPRFLDNQMQTRAVDQLSQWLLTAKQRAKRDGFATGVRILVDQSTGLANQMEYVQLPDPYTAGVCTGITPNSQTKTALFQAGSVDFQGAAPFAGYVDQNFGELSVVLAGDYLELNGGGSVYYISTVNQSSLVLENTNVQLTVPTSNYRIIRQPRRLLGEDALTLPQDMVIDMTPDPSNPSSTLLSKNVPSRIIAGGGGTPLNAYEILFTPSGNVLGKGTPSGRISLWVRNATKSATDPGAATLVTVQIRTGFIAAHPINITPGSDGTIDYYQFTEDGRSSGM